MLKNHKKHTPQAQLDRIANHNRQGSYLTKKRYYEAMSRFCRYLDIAFHLQNLAKIKVRIGFRQQAGSPWLSLRASPQTGVAIRLPASSPKGIRIATSLTLLAMTGKLN